MSAKPRPGCAPPPPAPTLGAHQRNDLARGSLRPPSGHTHIRTGQRKSYQVSRADEVSVYARGIMAPRSIVVNTFAFDLIKRSRSNELRGAGAVHATQCRLDKGWSDRIRPQAIAYGTGPSCAFLDGARSVQPSGGSLSGSQGTPRARSGDRRDSEKAAGDPLDHGHHGCSVSTAGPRAPSPQSAAITKGSLTRDRLGINQRIRALLFLLASETAPLGTA